jgi:isoquinoline 1-oxidoreductase beta subunit
MGKWTRRAFITAGVAAGGVVVFGVAIRRGDRAEKVRGLVAADGEALFDVWLKIAPDNTITAIIPHADMGQGVHTALAMMLADELDADWSTMRFQEAPAHKEFANYSLAREFSAPGMDFPSWLIDTVDGVFFRATQAMGVQITGGSLSVRTTGQVAMRVTGAAARAVLLEAAANEWGVPVSELGAGNGMIRHAATGREAGFAHFAPAAAMLPLPDKPALKSPDEFRIIGTSPPRFDVPAKVDGSAEFGIDASLPGMKHAAVKAAPVFGGRVLSVDESSIQDFPGVRKAVNLDDAVAVIADGYWQAHKALDKLAIEFSDGGNGAITQESIFERFAEDLDSAAAEGRENSDFVSGDAAAALGAAARVLEAEYRVPFLAHAPMEPMNCTAWVHDELCELWLGTQNPLGFARQVAKAVGMDPSQVIVHNQYLGGGFGRRAFDDFAIQAARIAANAPYPVKLVWSREEDMRHDHYRQAGISRFRGGLDAAGNAIAWHNHYVIKHDPEEAPHIPYAIANKAIVYSESETHVPWGRLSTSWRQPPDATPMSTGGNCSPGNPDSWPCWTSRRRRRAGATASPPTWAGALRFTVPSEPSLHRWSKSRSSTANRWRGESFAPWTPVTPCILTISPRRWRAVSPSALRPRFMAKSRSPVERLHNRISTTTGCCA